MEMFLISGANIYVYKFRLIASKLNYIISQLNYTASMIYKVKMTLNTLAHLYINHTHIHEAPVMKSKKIF